MTRTLAGLLLMLAVSLCQPALGQTDWPQLQRDSARSGYSPDSVGVPASGQCLVKWRWHPDKQTSIAGRVQPVVANNILCVGFYDGRMFAINTATGVPLWSYQAGGPILHTAAMDGARVYFGSYDGKVYALSLGTGQLAWSYDTGKPIYAAPCLSGGKILIGNGAGRFFAINANDGQLAWSYDTGRPIQTTAACAGGVVYCGSEGLYAFALDANTGQQRWKVRLKGQSMASYWPVVMESKGVVIFRTQPVNVFHEILGEGDATLGGGGYNALDGSAGDFLTEQQNIRAYLTGKKDSQTFWALDINTGAEKYLAPILYTAGEGATPVPPIFDPATGRAWVIGRSKYARFDSGSIVRAFGCEPAKFDPSTGNYTLFATEATKGSGIHCIGDETSILSADAYGLLVSARGTLGYIRHSPEVAVHVISSLPATYTYNGITHNDDYHHAASPLAYQTTAGAPYEAWSIQAGGGQGGGQCAAATVAQNSIYWIARWGLIVRVDRQ